MRNSNAGAYRKYIKRPLDFTLALIAIFFLSPLYLFLAVLVKLKLGSPVIFKQKRPGLNQKIFSIYKFRSMTGEKDSEGNLLPDDIRLTKFGKFLRSTSLDELPGLFNILKGDMSLIGPRPLAVEYLPYYTKEENMRHSVRPGLSGLAQINGRNTVKWEDRFIYDVNYINNICFKNDVLIIMKTISKVFRQEDVSVRGTGKIEDFHTYRKKQLGGS